MKRASPAGIVLTVIVLAYVSSALVLRSDPSEKTIGLVAGATCALLGLVLLAFCLPLGKLMNRALKNVPFMPEPIPWPRTTPGWVAFLVVAALAFFAVATVAFYWGTDPATQPAMIRWLEGVFR